MHVDGAKKKECTMIIPTTWLSIHLILKSTMAGIQIKKREEIGYEAQMELGIFFLLRDFAMYLNLQ